MKARFLYLRFISIACVILGTVYAFFLERRGYNPGVGGSSKGLLDVRSAPSFPSAAVSSPHGFIYRGRCPPSRVDLLVLIPSRLRNDNFERRKTLRTLMAALVDTSQFSLAYYFLLTRKGYSAVDVQAGEQENSTHKDMVWADDSIEDYNMVTKVWTELHSMNEYYRRSGVQEPTHWAKFDDDAFVLWDRFFPVMAAMPRESLVWCAQGSGAYAQAGGFSGIFCNGPYLFSFDVAKLIGNDENQKITSVHWSNEREKPGYNDDYFFPRHNFDRGTIKHFGADRRWHSDDMGDLELCMCKPWTLTSDTLVVHHPHVSLVQLWLSNKTAFALLGQPFRRYGYNVCAPQDAENPSCNWVEGCKGPPPAPSDCIIPL